MLSILIIILLCFNPNRNGSNSRIVLQTPEFAPEYDMWALEWKSDPEERVSKSQFSYLVASIEHFFPQFKKQIPLCREALKGWETSHHPTQS